jgi:wyosine [tRNA(Phe)-imidazoG37] synthetase (radical SAM superfamily)
MVVFGSIPSRRLGRSLGINNVSYKYCTYSCIYCQLGLTSCLTTLSRNFYAPDDIAQETENKLEELKKSDEKADYITFVPDGEPTLDINLGATIEKLKKFEIKLAIITNSSVLFENNIRNVLMLADWVSLKIDAVEPEIWRKINRPHGCLNLDFILNGIKDFASSYRGVLVTETMLVKGINDSNESITGMAFLLTADVF